MPRFVVLQHESPRGLHWDFMLESGPVLATWSLSEPPRPAADFIAESLPDHRLAYLDYEGPVSGGRGAVTRWDAGTCEVERQDENEVAVVLSGERLSGRVTLRRTADDPQKWTFLWRR